MESPLLEMFKTWLDRAMSNIIEGSPFNGTLNSVISRGQNLLSFSDLYNYASPLTLLGKC